MNFDALRLKFYNFFIEFKTKIRSTAYDDPMFCFVIDFYDPRANYYDKLIEIFGDDLSFLSSIEDRYRFKGDDNFRAFIEKCLKETYVNISDDLDDNLKKFYFIGNQIVNMMYFKSLILIIHYI